MLTWGWWRRPRYALWLAVGALLWWVLQTVPLGEVWIIWGQLGLLQVLALVLANGLILLSMSGRWWLILQTQGYPVPYLALVGYRLAAFGLSYFTPGPQFGGEPLQVYLVKRHNQVPGSTAIAAVTLDKLFELLVNFSFLVGGVVFVLYFEIFVGPVANLMVMFASALLAVPLMVFLGWSTGRLPFGTLLQVAERLIVWRPYLMRARWSAAYGKAAQVVRSGETQVAEFCQQQPLVLVQMLLISLLTWGALVGEYWLALHFLGVSLTPAQTVVALTAARLAILFPLPGGLGALEASQVLAMQVLALEPAVGLSLSLLIRVRDVLLGGLGLWWAGVKS